MQENLLIIFVKNILLGKVKTRLAKTVGDQAAFDVYKYLVDITEEQTNLIEKCDVRIYFSDVIIEEKWPGKNKYVQQGVDLGERMQNAFQDGFNDGYGHIIGVGSDLPDLTAGIMSEGLEELGANDAVFGPSEDGGYYLIGMNKMIPEIFTDKPWSTEKLLDLTISELESMNYTVGRLIELNDVDTIEDLAASSIAEKFGHLLVAKD